MAFPWNRSIFQWRPTAGLTVSGPAQRISPNSNQPPMVLLCIVIAALYLGREILIPLAFALVLTFVLSPVVNFVQKSRIGRVPSVVATVLATMAVAGCIAWVITVQLVDVATEVPRYRQNIHAKLQALRIPTQGPLGLAATSFKDIARELSSGGPTSPEPAPAVKSRNQRTAVSTPAPPVPVQIVEQPADGFAYLRELVQPVLRPLGLAGLVLIFSVFMLINRIDLRNRLLRLVGLGQINLMTQALDDAAQRVSRYLLMQLMVNAAFGTLFGVGLHLIGVPNPALWGAVAGLLRIVPYVGTLVAATLPIALAMAAFNSWLPPLLAFLLFAALEVVIANFVEPWLYGANTGISSLALLIAAVFWTILWGPAGLILSTPLTVCVVVLGRYVPQLSFLHTLLGDEVVLGPDAQLYQRLLAMDLPEARTIVDLFLKDKQLADLYDSVLIPALTLAEQDRHNGAIDNAREEFLYLSIEDMIAEFPEYQAPAIEEVAGDSVPVERRFGKVLCLPANDRADEVTAAMLAQLLEQAGHSAHALQIGHAAPAEVLALIEKRQDDVICISALPPYAFRPARTLCKLIRERFPRVKVVVGVWGFSGDAEKALARFERTRPDRLLTSLAQAVEQIQELIQSGGQGPSPSA